MPLQTTGAISLSDVQSEFGGSNPISMSEYYRGGAYVPTTISTGAGSYSSYQGNISTYYWSDLENAGTVSLRWNGSTVAGFQSSATTYTTGGYEYQKGTLFTSDSGGGGKGEPTTYYYRIRRRTVGSSTTVNTSIPASGTISMNQFYGGRNS
jgi:hypothetical protein